VKSSIVDSFLVNNQAGQAKLPRAVLGLMSTLRGMLDKRRPSSKNNVIDFAHAADRSQDATFLKEYQDLAGAVTDYFFIRDEDVSYEDYHYLKTRIGDLQQAVNEKKRTGSGTTVREKAGDFIDSSSRIRVAGIEKLSKNQLEQAYMATQQLEAEIQAQEKQSDLAVQQGQASADQTKDPDEIKTEKELALQAQLPFKKEKKLLTQLKTDLENVLRARQSSTPTMAR